MQTSGGLLLGQRQTLTLYKTQTIYSLCEQLVANFKKGGGGGSSYMRRGIWESAE
jgi:hypothetical protein